MLLYPYLLHSNALHLLTSKTMTSLHNSVSCNRYIVYKLVRTLSANKAHNLVNTHLLMFDFTLKKTKKLEHKCETSFSALDVTEL